MYFVYCFFDVLYEIDEENLFDDEDFFYLLIIFFSFCDLYLIGWMVFFKGKLDVGYY